MWDYRFGGTSTDEPFCFLQTSDKGFIVGGYSYSDIGGDKTQDTWNNSSDFWVVKIDSNGTKQWDKDFGGTGPEFIKSLCQTSDGGYMFGGFSNSGIGGDKTEPSWGSLDFWIIKTDSTGTKQWDKDFGGTEYDALTSLQQTKDGGYILGGISNSGISGDKTQPNWNPPDSSMDYWIVKIDSAGNKQWDRDFGGTNNDNLTSINLTLDGGYILGGFSISDISGDKTQTTHGYYDYWLVKIDSLGDKQWDKDFGGTESDYLSMLQSTIDGGFIIGGYSYSGIGGNKTQLNWDQTGNTSDYWIVKTDSIGNYEWDRDFGGTDYEKLFSISQTSDDGFLLAGDSYTAFADGDKTENNFDNHPNEWIVKTDFLGNKVWEKTILAPPNNNHGIAIQASNECFVIVNGSGGGIGGYKTQPAWNNTWDFWIAKFCDSTFTSNIAQFKIDTPSFSISPNPTTSQFIVNSKIFINNKSLIELFNPLGVKIYSSFYRDGVTVNCEQSPPGIYLVRLSDSEKQLTRKLVVE